VESGEISYEYDWTGSIRGYSYNPNDIDSIIEEIKFLDAGSICQ